MRAGRAAGVADEADQLALAHARTFFDARREAGEMAVDRRESSLGGRCGSSCRSRRWAPRPITMPSAAAYTGVPVAATRSTPSCMNKGRMTRGARRGDGDLLRLRRRLGRRIDRPCRGGAAGFGVALRDETLTARCRRGRAANSSRSRRSRTVRRCQAPSSRRRAGFAGLAGGATTGCSGAGRWQGRSTCYAAGTDFAGSGSGPIASAVPAGLSSGSARRP